MLINGDSKLLTQALGNLLDNAIDFTLPGGGIALVAEKRNEGVQLNIIDSERDAPDYTLERIFERFCSPPREDNHKSSGLRLASVREIAHLHHDGISLYN